VLPFVVIAAFIWFVFIKGIRRIQDKQLEAQRQHNETMEKLLERIAKALEKKDTGSM
jgi:large-conductance mechanosensitive channel